jgi:hypothetical protein
VLTRHAVLRATPAAPQGLSYDEETGHFYVVEEVVEQGDSHLHPVAQARGVGRGALDAAPVSDGAPSSRSGEAPSSATGHVPR